MKLSKCFFFANNTKYDEVARRKERRTNTNDTESVSADNKGANAYLERGNVTVTNNTTINIFITQGNKNTENPKKRMLNNVARWEKRNEKSKLIKYAHI